MKRLTKTEQAILESCGEARSVADIADACGGHPQYVRRILCSMADSGLVERIDPGPVLWRARGRLAIQEVES